MVVIEALRVGASPFRAANFVERLVTGSAFEAELGSAFPVHFSYSVLIAPIGHGVIYNSRFRADSEQIARAEIRLSTHGFILNVPGGSRLRVLKLASGSDGKLDLVQNARFRTRATDGLHQSHEPRGQLVLPLGWELVLSGQGYAVGSDLLRLVGGEPFWRDIGDAIKDHANIVVFVLSSTNRPDSWLQRSM